MQFGTPDEIPPEEVQRAHPVILRNMGNSRLLH